MLRATSLAVCAIAAALSLSACGGSGGQVVTSTGDEVVISISKKDAKDLNSALQSATEIAEDECEKAGKMAKFDHSEEAAGGVITHFNCIASAESAE